MTQLYKKTGAVFIPAGITIEEVEMIEKENEELKAFESHCDEIEEDAKFIAKENAELKAQIEKMKCCANCEKYRMFENQMTLKCLKNQRTNFCCNEWEVKE